MFRQPIPDNRGVYECIATNKIGTTHIKYTAFIGGGCGLVRGVVTDWFGIVGNHMETTVHVHNMW